MNRLLNTFVTRVLGQDCNKILDVMQKVFSSGFKACLFNQCVLPIKPCCAETWIRAQKTLERGMLVVKPITRVSHSEGKLRSMIG